MLNEGQCCMFSSANWTYKQGCKSKVVCKFSQLNVSVVSAYGAGELAVMPARERSIAARLATMFQSNKAYA